MKRFFPVILAALALLFAHRPAAAEERAQIADRYKWNLSDLYPSTSAWETARQGLARRIPQLARFQGRLGVSAESLWVALSTMSNAHRDLARLRTYASQRSDEDVRIARHIEMKEAAEKLAVDYDAATSYVQPELLALGSKRVDGFLAAEPRLAEYRHYLRDLLRRAPHTLSRAEEKILAQAGALTDAGGSIRDVFANAEMPFPDIILSDGQHVRLDAAAYTRYRQAVRRADRDSVFRAFFRAHHAFRGTLGATLNAQVKAHVFHRDVRKFRSCLEAALFQDNIPPKVYTQLLSDVQANLPTLHRYLRLRKRMMGVDTLRYEDLYAPIVQSVEMKFTPEEAMDHTLQALAPLGRDYVETLRKGLTGGWVDWLPNTGKASGAYSTGAYGVHPYQLQNFTGLYDEVGTLAHESGHSMHTYLADAHQPYASHDYATFVAEVASTLNENLLFHYELDHTRDRDRRLFLLGTYLDGLRTTMFRQTLFAEFELRMHEMVERGEALSGDNLSKLYLELVRKYYGHRLGVCRVDQLYGSEWAYVPHFFYDFYVYQYATSIVASNAIANGIRQEAAQSPPSTKRRDAFLALMAAGGSQYPIDLLKDAGVDMTTSGPFRAAMKEMNLVMDEMEKLLRSGR